MLHRSETLRLVVWGDFGLFTRPEFRSDRVSQLMIPPTAAEGIVKSIFWHPEADIHNGEKNRLGVEVSTIHVLNPIQTMRMRKNEVGKLPSKDKACLVEARQTSLTLLKDPKYLIEFTYVTDDDQMLVKKAAEIFKRRLVKGQCFRQPCFGRKRYAAFFREATKDDYAIPTDIELGKLPWHIEYEVRGNNRVMETHNFDAKLEAGVLNIPSYFDHCISEGKEIRL